MLLERTKLTIYGKLHMYLAGRREWFETKADVFISDGCGITCAATRRIVLSDVLLRTRWHGVQVYALIRTCSYCTRNVRSPSRSTRKVPHGFWV